MEKGLAEREINLWDMFWAVCLKWRSILVCAVICAVLAGGYSYSKSVSSVEATKTAEETIDVTDLYADLEMEEKNDVDVYLDYKKVHDDIVYYNQNAPLMRLDASSYYVGEIGYYIDNHYSVEYPYISKNNNIIALVNAYRAVLNSDTFCDKVEAIIGEEYDSSFALELIDCKGIYAGEQTVFNNEKEGVFAVYVYADNEEVCQGLKELVKEEINGEEANIVNQYGAHDIYVLQDVIVNMSNDALMNMQRNNIDLAFGSSYNMNHLSAAFSDKQKKYIDQVLTKDLNDSDLKNADVVIEAKPGISFKLILLGFLVGFVLLFFAWAFMYIVSKRIRLEDNFEKIFESRLLGNVSGVGNKKKKLFGYFDKLILKIRHYNQRYFDREDALNMVAANIRIATNQSGRDQLIVTGAICGMEEKQIAEDLAAKLKKDNIEVIFTESFLYNAESLEKIVKIGNVVLVEKAEKSLCNEIAKEIEVCKQQGVNLIGCVVAY